MPKNNTFIVDPIIGAPVGIDVVHHEVHGGHLFSAIHATSIGSGGVNNIILQTPTTGTIHSDFSIMANGALKWEGYENIALTGTGTASTLVVNHNRNSTTTAGVGFWHAATMGVSTAVMLTAGYMGAGGTPISNVGGVARADQEYILQPNKYYALSITAATNLTVVIKYGFYKES